MIYSKVIIVGGGPAGSSCGWKLKQNGIECLILDKEKFPRTKLCAGWITPQVIDDLKINIQDYPHSLKTFNQFHVHISSQDLEIKVHQYAIRRYEFDYWLLQRSGVEVRIHEVREIKKDGDYYVIDNLYRCKYLVGAGGTHCPVYRKLFKSIRPRQNHRLLVTLEEEFPYDYQDSNCHLWFRQNNHPGYSWYVPKSDGYINIGIGGFAEKLKSHTDHIKNQWAFFTQKLDQLSLVKNHRFNAGGYTYYVRSKVDSSQNDRAYIIGDAAGLATKDMGEGIGPAVKSGLLAADAISFNTPLSFNSIKRYSFPRYRTAIQLLGAFVKNI